MDRTIFVVCADPDITRQCIKVLAASGMRYQVPVVRSMEQALLALRGAPPPVIFLDESAIQFGQNRDSLETAAALLTETAPVVVSAAANREAELAFLIASGAVDFIARTDYFPPMAAMLLDRRIRLAERSLGIIEFTSRELGDDFGELLRHEVNNPLTGILGNTELLLAKRDRLPPGAAERLQTIADAQCGYGKRLRRLSNAWDESHASANRA